MYAHVSDYDVCDYDVHSFVCLYVAVNVHVHTHIHVHVHDNCLIIYNISFSGIDDTLNTCYHEALNLMTQKGGGVMLICGTGGGGMVGGCGKTSLAMLLCKELSESYMKPHVITKSCTLLRGLELSLELDIYIHTYMYMYMYKHTYIHNY